MVSLRDSSLALSALLSLMFFLAPSALAALEQSSANGSPSANGAVPANNQYASVSHDNGRYISAMERETARRMTDMTPASQSDYGYISERELITLSRTMRPDAELIRRTEEERRSNMARARSMSLLELNQLMSQPSPTLSHIPYENESGFMGASVYMHMMHLDYARAMHEQWVTQEYQNEVRANARNMGEVHEDDVSFYRRHGYEKACTDYRFSICMTRFSPTINSIFTINHYAHELKDALSINHDNVYSNYTALWNFNEHLQDIIRQDLKDSNTVGVKEYRQLQERISRTGQVSFDRTLNAEAFAAANHSQVIKTQDEVRAAAAAAASNHSDGSGNSGVDIMISLDDLPNGYDQDYEKYNKKFSIEFLNGTASSKSDKDNSTAQSASSASSSSGTVPGVEGSGTGAEPVDIMITLDDLPYGYDKSYERHNKRFSASMMFSGSDNGEGRPVKIQTRDESNDDDKTKSNSGSDNSSAHQAKTVNMQNSQQQPAGAQTSTLSIANDKGGVHPSTSASVSDTAARLHGGDTHSALPNGSSDSHPDGLTGASLPAIVPIPMISLSRTVNSVCQLGTDERLSAYGGHGGLQIVQPVLPVRALQRKYVREILGRHSNISQEALWHNIKSNSRPSFEDDQGSYLEYSLRYHISSSRLKNKGYFIKGTDTPGPYMSQDSNKSSK